MEDLVQEKLIAVRTRRSTVERSGPQSASTHAVAMHKRIDDLRWRKAAGAPVDQAGDEKPAKSEDAAARHGRRESGFEVCGHRGVNALCVRHTDLRP